MKVREIKYNIAHLDIFNSTEDIALKKIETEYNNEAITIIINDIPIISCGLRLLNDQTGEIWMVKNKYLYNYKVYIIKRIKQLIDFYAEKYKLKRIQTLIESENIKWIKLLEFEMETELKNFSIEEVYLYRRLF